MKIATYIAGDSNIVIPGLVSLTSIKYFNKNLDTFLFTDNFTQEKDPHINKIIKDNDIKIVKNHVINSICSISKFKNFDRWPRHVYYNYIAPIYLYELGYKYAIKVDYDILCLAEYDLQNILPSEEDILTIALRNKIINYISNPQNINFDFGNYKTVNAGFIFINLKQYKEKNILQLFKELYFYFSSIKSSEYIEQLALAAIQAKLQRSFKALPLEYNYRPSYPIKKNICNIHYNLGNKPWLCNSLKDLSPDRFKNMLLSNLWIKWANYIGLKQYIKNDEYHPFDFLIAFENIFNHLDNISLLREYSLFIFNNCIVPPGTQININNMNGGGISNCRVQKMENYIMKFLLVIIQR